MDKSSSAHSTSKGTDLERLQQRCAELERQLGRKEAIISAAFSQSQTGVVVTEGHDMRISLVRLEGLGIDSHDTRNPCPAFSCSSSAQWRLLRKDGVAFEENEHPLFLATRDGATTENLEALVERADDENTWVLVNAVPIQDESGKVTAGVMTLHDIGRLKSMEADRIQGLTFFAHDMKSPLFSARSFVRRLLEGKAGSLSDEQQQEVVMVRELLDRVLTLAMDFLDVARMDKEGFALSLEPMDIAPLLQRLGQEFAVRAQREGMKLEMSIEEGLRRMRGDKRRLERVFVNLLDNALKYSSEGAVWLNAHNGVEDWIIIDVSDEGPGLTQEDMEGLFKTFHRGAAGESAEGSGLGLAAARSIVEAHGGGICAANHYPKGARFTVLLPTLNRSRKAPPVQESEGPASS